MWARVQERSQAWGIRGLRPGWQGKIFCNLQGVASSNSALVLLYSQDKNLASVSIAIPDVHLTIFWPFFFYVVHCEFLNTTINNYKSYPEYFPLNHQGIFWNSPITHDKMDPCIKKKDWKYLDKFYSDRTNT